MDICIACPTRKNMRCGNCGCLLEAKTRLPEEECPEGRWKSVVV